MRRLVACMILVLAVSATPPAFAGGKSKRRSRPAAAPDPMELLLKQAMNPDIADEWAKSLPTPTPPPGGYLGGLPASSYSAFGGGTIGDTPRGTYRPRRYYISTPPVLPPGFGFGSIYGVAPPLFGPPYATGR